MSSFRDDYTMAGDRIVQTAGMFESKLSSLPFSKTEKVSVLIKSIRFALPNKKIDYFLKYTIMDENSKKKKDIVVTDISELYDAYDDLIRLFDKYFEEIKAYCSYFPGKYKFDDYIRTIKNYLKVMEEQIELMLLGQVTW